jgi:hypothetical protein
MKTTERNRRAVLADIHGNLEALKAVLTDIERRGIKEHEIVYLGDVIGYGPDTVEVTDLAARSPIRAKGNHEEAIMLLEAGLKVGGLVASAGINQPAAESLVIGRKQIKDSGEKADERFRSLTSLPLETRVIKDAITGIHDFRRGGKLVYVMPEKLASRYRIRGSLRPEEFFSIFKESTQVVLKGNDHTQWAVILGREGKPYQPEGNPFEVKSGEKAIIGVGSVGLARKQDRAFTRRAEKLGLIKKPMLYATYTILNGRAVEFASVLYSPTEVRQRTIAAGMPDVYKARYPFLPKLEEPEESTEPETD